MSGIIGHSPDMRGGGVIGEWPEGNIRNVHWFINSDVITQTTDDWDFIDSGSLVFKGTKILMMGSVSVTSLVADSHNVGFRFFDDTTHLTGADGVAANSWLKVVSSTGFTGSVNDVRNLNGSFLYTHGESLPYTTNIKIQIVNSAGDSYKLNRASDNDAGNSSVRTMSASSLTLFDIA